MYFATRKQYQAGEAVLVGLTKQQRRQVLRAAKTGTPPADLTLRARAVALLEVRLANYARNRTPNLVVFSGAAVLSAVAGITSGWWYWGAVAASGYVLVSVIRYPAKHQRNLATLQPPPIPNPPAKVRR